MAGAALADAIFGALESEHSFSTKYWETQPLLVHRPELAAQLSALLSAADLPVLSERLEARDKVHQCMREGESCEPRELCWDFLEGGSIILNKLDVYWPPVGRLCAALRERFLHVFAVMYLTPRGSRSVPAHSDDQDVFIVQLAGRKAWNVYGSPIDLPYSHEQLGKTAPVDRASLGAPLLTAELAPGSVLYMPRGFVHEARATEGGASLHITLTVQTSDLNWRTFVGDGLMALHRTHDEARLPLPLDASAGGYPEGGAGVGIGRAAEGAVIDGVYSPSVDCTDPTAPCHAPAHASPDASADAAEASGAAGGGLGAQSPSSSTVDLVRGLMSTTASEWSRGFDLAMGMLTTKLAMLNGAQDAAIATDDGVSLRVGVLPPWLRCPRGVTMAIRPVPVSRAVQLVCTKKGGSLTVTFDARFLVPLSFIADSSGSKNKVAAFQPTDLPGCDAFEQVALCSRLLQLQALEGCVL